LYLPVFAAAYEACLLIGREQRAAKRNYKIQSGFTEVACLRIAQTKSVLEESRYK
jgi:hypothetical protein